MAGKIILHNHVQNHPVVVELIIIGIPQHAPVFIPEVGVLNRQGGVELALNGVLQVAHAYIRVVDVLLQAGVAGVIWNGIMFPVYVSP
ncbi:MAG: hypothetical protein A2161_06055 [Candidatus Schekmanbacteria bacterium RBG_13_48_7]|uniref:Uncharacterized protein n=1 Tax=Candidatus Schekmanbacteria bacterium RBG_13_48_7 TaxID=1817878 RepID=A0A1F7RNX8_9BACT|nr:MAG: hypothetical protein A2161_06055 [Candidatus Schekmanbacteria bacterium RBG_13_48_7]